MPNGRIETYIHSDHTTENKGAALVKVTATTDFAARTESFKTFARAAAMHAYGTLARVRVFIAGPDMWQTIIGQYPDLETQRLALERELGETIRVTEIAILRL